MENWQMQKAKANLSELVKRAASQGPQEITVHGRPIAVMLSKKDYDLLTGNARSLVEFMQASPLYAQDEVEFPRDRSLTREVVL